MTDAEAYGGTGHRDGRTLFDAVLHPHRSPGHIGFLVLMLCVSLVSFTGGLIFVAVGAWPVLGFLGANVVLITIAFKLNYRSGRQMERLRLTLERLEIERKTYQRQQDEIARLEDFVRRHHHGKKHAQAEDRRKKLERIEPVDVPREVPSSVMSSGFQGGSKTISTSTSSTPSTSAMRHSACWAM